MSSTGGLIVSTVKLNCQGVLKPRIAMINADFIVGNRDVGLEGLYCEWARINALRMEGRLVLICGCESRERL